MDKKQTKTIRIQWVRSGIGFPKKQKQVLRGLGFRKLQQVVERPDDDSIRGMIFKVSHLVRIVE